MAKSQPDTDEAKEARKWKKELQIAKKREADWVTEADKIVKRYRGEEKKRNRFNVLWSNTEVLRPAIYNSKPSPDVRRRFRDADPIGKAVSTVLERSLSVFVDGDETDDAIKNDVLDGLLPGRGVSRIRYVPKIAQAPYDIEDDDEADDAGAKARPNPNSTDDVEPDEELESEEVCPEHVDWKDFRHGYGRVWPEVPWVGFRHMLCRADAEEKFGKDVLESVQFTVPEGNNKDKPVDQTGETQKVAEFWEIWDKLGECVFFVQESLHTLLYPLANPDGEPPVDFPGFFPCPQPLQLVENTGSLLPTPIFRLYEDQANQLDKISARIDKIVNTMRLRGVYDARITEMADVLSSEDNDMIPTQNAKQWLDGGLDKAISWVPVEKNAQILEALYEARDRQKAIIDELLGISDIIRGATDPDETATAQNLKSNYGSVRLQRMQKEVQRYARDLLRLAASAMAQKFSPATFHLMTELQFPTAQQKALLQQQLMQQQMQAMAPQAPPSPGLPHGAPPGAPGPAPMAGPPPGPPIDPTMLKMPTWEDIIGLMRSEKMRQFKIDVETDSTVAGTLSSDMAGLSQVLTAVSQTMTELAPMVQAQVLPVDSAKELIMAVIRRSRLGSAVEDAFDKMQPPKPQQTPHDIEMAKVQAQNQGQVQVAQAKAEADIKIAQMSDAAEAQQFQVEEQAKRQTDAIKQHLEQQRVEHDAQVKLQMDERDKQHELAMEQIRQESAAKLRDAELLNARLIADAANQTKIMVAELAANVQREAHAAQAAQAAATAAAPQDSAEAPKEEGEQAPPAANYAQTESQLAELIKNLTDTISRPRQVIRDGSGRIAGLH